MGFNKEFHRKRLKRENGGVKHHTKRDDKPVAQTELEQIGKDNFVGGNRSKVEILFRPFLQGPVNDRSHHAQGGEGQSDQEGGPATAVGRARPGRRGKRGKASEARRSQDQSKGKAQLLASEPGRQRSGDRNIE